LPSNVKPSMFLADPKVMTGLQKGMAAKLGVDHTWVTLTTWNSQWTSYPVWITVTLDFTITFKAKLTANKVSVDDMVDALSGAAANSIAEKTAWATNVVKEIKAASPTTYASFSAASVTTKSVYVAAFATEAPEPTVQVSGAHVKMHLVMMAIGLARLVA